MQLLTTELANQDPLDPTDDTSFYSQMAQMGTLQGVDELQTSSTVQQAQSLMGSTVTALEPVTQSSNGLQQQVTGVVTTLYNTDGNYTVGIQEANGGVAQVPLSSIQSVTGSSMSNLASMIGKTVSGTGSITTNGVASTISAVGQVVGISNTSSGMMLQVQTSSNGIVAVAPSSVTNVASS
jgi:flagellar basal-body rod modification protein FlgD